MNSKENLLSLIGNATNIEVLGFVSDDELYSFYTRAKVFALPSLNEGVGLVALEAAMHGCNIVITRLGGPKEYYPAGMAQLVDPYSTDDIGQAILRAMDDYTSQPKLRNHLEKTYNVSSCTDLLVKQYTKIISR